jgi:hypothetical protein
MSFSRLSGALPQAGRARLDRDTASLGPLVGTNATALQPGATATSSGIVAVLGLTARKGIRRVLDRERILQFFRAEGRFAPDIDGPSRRRRCQSRTTASMIVVTRRAQS